jgi:glutathione peroxidase
MARLSGVNDSETFQTGARKMNRLIALLLIGVMIMIWGCGKVVDGKQQEKTALRFKMESLNGQEVDLAKYAGKVVMVVNVASKCGYTSQYEQLQALHEKYSEQGLAILGFPCNQFLGQEPGSAEEIRQFCRSNYGVTFDMFAKVDVKGENACDLYRLLTALDTKPKGAGKIGWNFEKFILDRNGFVVARFGSSTKPDDPEVISIIEAELAKQADSANPETTPHPEQPREVNLADYAWKNRIAIAFIKSRSDANYADFRREWNGRRAETSDRDLLLFEISEDGESRLEDTIISPASAEKLRNEFEVEPGTTTFVLVGKDGTEKLRKSEADLDELFEVIDAMPMRKREMKKKEQG